jgi:hypothetical protein
MLYRIKTIAVFPVFCCREICCRQLSAELLIIIGKLVDNYRQNCRQLSATKLTHKNLKNNRIKNSISCRRKKSEKLGLLGTLWVVLVLSGNLQIA